jgi:hypothetical protein
VTRFIDVALGSAAEARNPLGLIVEPEYVREGDVADCRERSYEGEGDSPERLAADIVAAGGGLCDPCGAARPRPQRAPRPRTHFAMMSITSRGMWLALPYSAAVAWPSTGMKR